MGLPELIDLQAKLEVSESRLLFSPHEFRWPLYLRNGKALSEAQQSGGVRSDTGEHGEIRSPGTGKPGQISERCAKDAGAFGKVDTRDERGVAFLEG